jgi:protein-S-isoprenylcysteine O-methyltransferase Ste14
MHFPLKRTGRLLARMGGSQPHQWGCTTKLVTTDIYGCLRHPHHFGIGVFMTSLGLLIGHIWTFLILTIVQWTWIVAFLLLVEEKELEQKFGEEYKRYRSRVPMLLASPRCLMRVLASPLPRDPDGSERPV